MSRCGPSPSSVSAGRVSVNALGTTIPRQKLPDPQEQNILGAQKPDLRLRLQDQAAQKLKVTQDVAYWQGRWKAPSYEPKRRKLSPVEARLPHDTKPDGPNL